MQPDSEFSYEAAARDLRLEEIESGEDLPKFAQVYALGGDVDPETGEIINQCWSLAIVNDVIWNSCPITHPFDARGFWTVDVLFLEGPEQGQRTTPQLHFVRRQKGLTGWGGQ